VTSVNRATTAVGTRSGPLVPRYGHSTLADLLPGIAAHLGVPGFRDDVLGLPSASRYVVLLVDGLGWQQLHSRVRDVPYLADRLGDARRITSGVPSTTVTSLTSLGTGQPPGTHGIVGYTFWLPEQRRVLNPLVWDVDVSPTVCQPWPTVFDAAGSAGVAVTSVSLNRFADSGLTQAALRGAAFSGFESEADEQTRIDLIRDAAARGSRSLVYAYERELDHTGHALGCASDAWLSHLRRIDHMCLRLREALPADTVLLVTADHGMIDIPPDHRLIAEDDPELMSDVAVFAGEGRLRQLYLRAGGSADQVAQRWADRLGELAWVRTRDEAIDDGWFGPVKPMVAGRVGDVLVALRSDWAVMTRTIPRELSLVGMHGSLTPAEMEVPLVVDAG